MGEIKDFTKEKLVIGVLSTLPGSRGELIRILEQEFGTIDYESPCMDFNFTNYYVPEMGSGIQRCFYSFETCVDPSTLYDIKIRTNRMEERFSAENMRKINLDPGLLSLDRFMLATTKNNGHRIPLKEGIYAEVTLLFVNKKFEPLPWTYTDFRSREYQDILLKIRALYKKNLKEMKQEYLS